MNMARKLVLSLQWALLLAWLAASTATEHSDLDVHVFSSLLTENEEQSTPPPYPEGLPLKLICQAPARKTYWYEKTPQKKEPVPLDSISSSPIAGVENSVYTIPRLRKKDDGREFLCMMDSSSIRKIVKLAVVGGPFLSVDHPTKRGSGIKLKCSSINIDPRLDLCWYRHGERLKCSSPNQNEGTSSASISTHVTLSDPTEEIVMECRAEFKKEIDLFFHTREAQDSFGEMFDETATKVIMKPEESTSCSDITSELDESDTKTFSLRVPDTNHCWHINIDEQKTTTSAQPSSTTPMATTKTSSTIAEQVTDSGGDVSNIAGPLLLLSLVSMLA